MVVNSDTTTDKKKKIYGYFKQKNATVHTANYSTAGLQELFRERSVTRRFCPNTFPDGNQYEFLCGTMKYEAHISNSHPSQELKNK